MSGRRTAGRRRAAGGGRRTAGCGRVEIGLTVNGDPYRVSVFPNRTLLDVLRDDLGLTGTKRGCDQGECGACTVDLDGRTVNACLVLAVDVDGSRVTTIEGLARRGVLHPLQRAFLEEGAVQCGYCTPGMILQGAAVLAEDPRPTTARIRAGISGNLCRCTGYAKIVKAIAAAGAAMEGAGAAGPAGGAGPGRGGRATRAVRVRRSS